MVKTKFACFALLVAIAGSGCVVRARGQVSAPVAYVEVEQEPPPPRVWIRETRPNYVYIQGRWDWRGGQWVWMDGRWEGARVNQRWEDGRWERRGRGHVYVEGRWSAGGGVRHDNRHDNRDHNNGNVRDHRRDNNPPPAPQGGNAGGNSDGPVIRDHRR